MPKARPLGFFLPFSHFSLSHSPLSLTDKVFATAKAGRRAPKKGLLKMV